MISDAEFEEFVRETQVMAVRFASGYLGDWEEARDAAQEAYVRAHRKLGTVRDAGALKGWFMSILANHLRDRLRRRKLRDLWGKLFGGDDVDAPDRAPSPEAGAIGAELKNQVALAVARLPTRQREVFTMKSLAGLTFAEIAAALSISDGAAKTHHARAVAALKVALSGWREDAV